MSATLGLLAVAFIVERGAPAKGAEPRLQPKKLPASHRSPTHGRRDNRVRKAPSPSDIPAKGWKDILWRVYGNIGEHRILALAAGMTYYSILAIFPVLAALVAIYGLSPTPLASQSILTKSRALSPAARLMLPRTVDAGRIKGKPGPRIHVRDRSDRIALERERRDEGVIRHAQHRVRRTGKARLPQAQRDVAGVHRRRDRVHPVGAGRSRRHSRNAGISRPVECRRSPDPDCALARNVSRTRHRPLLHLPLRPSRAAPRWRWITWGSAAATILWIAASALFSFYAANFGTFNETYGSLGAAIGFMTWLWISAIAILLGAELNAEMEHQTTRDTTTGKPKPLGARGAKMADRWLYSIEDAAKIIYDIEVRRVADGKSCGRRKDDLRDSLTNRIYPGFVFLQSYRRPGAS